METFQRVRLLLDGMGWDGMSEKRGIKQSTPYLQRCTSQMPHGGPWEDGMDSDQGFSEPWGSLPLARRDKGFPFPWVLWASLILLHSFHCKPIQKHTWSGIKASGRVPMAHHAWQLTDPLSCQGGLESDCQLQLCGGVQVLHPQEATWGKRGLTLTSLVTNVGPRGLLSPLFEGKSGLGIEMTSNCIFLSSWQFRVLRNGRTLHSFYGSSKVLTPGFTQKIAHRK